VIPKTRRHGLADDEAVHGGDLLPDGTRQEYTPAIPFRLTPAGAMNR